MVTAEIKNKLRRQLAKNAVNIAGDNRPVTEPKPRIDNGPLLRYNDLRIIHLNVAYRKRKVTIAYRATNDLIEFATAITHPKDTFVKKVGTQLAVQAFVAGKTVKFPRRSMGILVNTPEDVANMFKRMYM